MSDIRLDIDGSGLHAARRQRLGRILAAVGVLLLAGVVLLPSLLSTPPGRGFLLARVNQRIAGSVSAETISTGWLSGSRVGGLGLRDPEGLPVVRGLDASSADTGFAGLLLAWWRGDPSGITAAVEVAEVDLWRARSGRLNLWRSLAAAEQPGVAEAQQGPAGPRGWRERVGWAGHGVRTPPPCRVDVRVGRLRWAPTHGGVATEALGVRGVVDTVDPDAVAVSLRADTGRGGTRGSVDAELVLRQAVTPAGVLVLREAVVEAKAEAQSFPVALLSELVGAEGVAEALLGGTLDASVEAGGTLAAPRLDLSLRSPTLEGRLKLVEQAPGVAAASGSGLTWRLTPEAFASLAGRGGWELQEETTLRLRLEELRIPEGAAGAQPEWASLRVVGDADDARLRRPGQALALEGVRVRATSNALGRRLDASLAGGVRRPEGLRPLRAALVLLNARAPRASGRPELRAEVDGLPSELLALAGPAGSAASRFLGPELGFRAVATQEAPAGRLRLRPESVLAEAQLDSQGLSGPLTLRLFEAGRSGVLATPVPLRLTLRGEQLGEAGLPGGIPGGLSGGLLGSLAEVRLDQPLTATLDVREARWGLLPGGGAGHGDDPPPAGAWRALLRTLDPAATGVSASLALDDARLRGRRGGIVGLAGVVVDVAAERLGEQPELFVSGRVLPPEGIGSGREPGTVRGRLRVSELLDERGQLRPAGALLNGRLGGSSLPAETLDRLLAADGRVPALLGPVFSPVGVLDSTPGQPARLTVTFDSKHAVGGFSVRLVGGRLELAEGGRLQLALDEAGADAVRGRLHPLTLDLIRGVPGHPIELVPAAGGVLDPGAGWAGWLPLLDGATVRPGRVELAGDGWLATAIGDAVRQRVPGFRNRLGRRYVLEGSAATLSLRDERLGHGPMWLTSPDLRVGLQGWSEAGTGAAFAATAPEQASRVSMRLGLPVATLRSLTPGLDALPRGAVYELPIGGWIDNPRVQTDRFATDLLLADGRDALEPWRAPAGAWTLPPSVRIRLDGLAGPAGEGGGTASGTDPLGSPPSADDSPLSELQRQDPLGFPLR